MSSAVFLVASVLVLAETAEIRHDTLGAQVRGKRSDDGGPLEAVVQQLSQQVTSLTAQLTQLTNTINSKMTVLEAKTARLEKNVAFHAWNGQTTHVAAGGTIILDQLVTNVGNAYDPLTGVFTAPVSGLYDFQLRKLQEGP